MRAETLAYARQLSQSDPKDLGGKALKASEEVGELAKAAAAYLGSAGARHRVVGPERILEEVVDTMLAVLSAAYHLGFSDEQIDAEMARKSTFWADRQAAEGAAVLPLPFEIHITVEPGDMDIFRSVCGQIGVKPLLLDLQGRSGSVVRDMQTSSVFHGDNTGAAAESVRIAKHLAESGFTVLRRKIETIPHHPAAPSDRRPGIRMPPGCYFEAHLQVECDDRRRELLGMIAKNSGAHLSRNAFKTREDGGYIIMITHRRYEGALESFRLEVDRILSLLSAGGFEVGKVITEFAILDTASAHDSQWLE